MNLTLGHEPVTIVAHSGREYRFEPMRSGGIAWVNRRGDELKNSPPLEAWWAAEWWRQQGERVDGDGIAIWYEPEPKRMVRLSRGSYRLAEPNEPHDEIWREKPRLWTGRLPKEPQ